jgi:hypothetical protein
LNHFFHECKRQLLLQILRISLSEELLSSTQKRAGEKVSFAQTHQVVNLTGLNLVGWSLSIGQFCWGTTPT